VQGPYIEDCFWISPFGRDFDAAHKRDIEVDIHIMEDDHILVTVEDNPPRRIDTEDVMTAVAWRTCFVCPCCSEKVSKLYLLPNGKDFKCRHCHKLKYRLTGINKNTTHGRALYEMARMDKLIKMREKLGTIIYNGKFTKKFKSYLRQCKRLGYVQAIEDAKRLIEALKIFGLRIDFDEV
jgi:hypothetical protein